MILSMIGLLALFSAFGASISLHTWANAQRVAVGPLRFGSARWWFRWPREGEFPDHRTWRLAALAWVGMIVSLMIMLGWNLASLIGTLRST